MFRTILFFGLMLLAPLSFGDETSKYIEVERILKLSGADSFISMVGHLKKGQDVNPANPFYPDEKLDEEVRNYWRSFPLGEYSSGLKKQFMDLFSGTELGQVKVFYENPFRSKILILLNTDASLVDLREKLLNEDFEGVVLSKNKINLIQSIINLHKINPLIEDQKEKLKSEIRRQRKLLEILSDNPNNPVKQQLSVNEVLLKEFDVRLLKYYGAAFEDVRESELREMVRVMTSKRVQDAAQLMVSYHYYFLEKYEVDYRQKLKTLPKKEESLRY